MLAVICTSCRTEHLCWRNDDMSGRSAQEPFLGVQKEDQGIRRKIKVFRVSQRAMEVPGVQPEPFWASAIRQVA
jgi:hypothetical protein